MNIKIHKEKNTITIMYKPYFWLITVLLSPNHDLRKTFLNRSPESGLKKFFFIKSKKLRRC